MASLSRWGRISEKVNLAMHGRGWMDWKVQIYVGSQTEGRFRRRELWTQATECGLLPTGCHANLGGVREGSG
jgi:hypothetical protein